MKKALTKWSGLFVWVREREEAPLCKGSWHGGAVTEGLLPTWVRNQRWWADVGIGPYRQRLSYRLGVPHMQCRA